jgi:hypothetical protein
MAKAVIALAIGACLFIGTSRQMATADEALGRLFFTPERRQQLDRQRDLNLLDKQQIPAEPTLTIDGIVTRSSGKSTAWINGIPQHEHETGSGLSVRASRGDPGKVVLRSTDSPAARARVGETVTRSTGESVDLLNGGQIRVKAGSQAAR